MRKLKLLYWGVDRSKFICNNEAFKRELKVHPSVEVVFTNLRGDIREIIKRLNFEPNFIFIDNYIEDYCVLSGKPLTGLDKVNIPKGVLLCDVHNAAKFEFKEFILKNNIDIIFAHYRDAFLMTYPQFRQKFRWLPLFADISVYKNYYLDKTIDYMLIGYVDKVIYPLRHLMLLKYKNKRNFYTTEHPGYGPLNNLQFTHKPLIGIDYAKKINEAKLFFTDDSVFKYPIGKYFEVPACYTLLIASGSSELQDLGFVDGKTFVEVNKTNFNKKALYYLKNNDERMLITENGYNMIRDNHTTEIRVEQFLDMINKYLS